MVVVRVRGAAVLAALLLMPTAGLGHGAIITPRSRNS
jgi:hypothetical protein